MNKAKMWRKNLTELINETNNALKINEHWEHRSFKELGMEELPTIHLGSKANALEKKGIHTERGDYNHKVMEIRGIIDFIAKTSASIENFKARIKDTSNEVIELIESVCKRHKILQLPIISGKFLRKVSHRERLQDPNNMVAFVESKNITTFDSLQGYLDEHEKKYDRLNQKLIKGEGEPEHIKIEIKSELSGLAFAEVLIITRQTKLENEQTIREQKNLIRLGEGIDKRDSYAFSFFERRAYGQKNFKSDYKNYWKDHIHCESEFQGQRKNFF